MFWARGEIHLSLTQTVCFSPMLTGFRSVLLVFYVCVIPFACVIILQKSTEIVQFSRATPPTIQFTNVHFTSTNVHVVLSLHVSPIYFLASLLYLPQFSADFCRNSYNFCASPLHCASIVWHERFSFVLQDYLFCLTCACVVRL